MILSFSPRVACRHGRGHYRPEPDGGHQCDLWGRQDRPVYLGLNTRITATVPGGAKTGPNRPDHTRQRCHERRHFHGQPRGFPDPPHVLADFCQPLVCPDGRVLKLPCRLAGWRRSPPLQLPGESFEKRTGDDAQGLPGELGILLDGFGESQAAQIGVDLDRLHATIVAENPGTARPRTWALRPSVTAYNAAYVALAEALASPLVTRDARLVHAFGITVAYRSTAC